jgi:Phosphate-selective porin O and P
MSRIKSISLLAGAAIGFATAASAQTSRDAGLALSAEIAAQNSAMESSLQPGAGPTVFGFTKFRLNYNSRDSVPGPAGAEDTAQGFSNGETRVGVQGEVGDFGYVFSGSFGPDGGFRLTDAYVTHEYDNGWSAKAGQFKSPFMRENAVSDTGLQGVDRSIVYTVYSMMRVQGVGATYTTENWRASAAVSDGGGSANTDFTSGGEADFAISGRFEYLIQGSNWDVFDDFASFQGSDTSYMAGGGIQYQTGGDTFASGSGVTADTDVLGLTGDFTAEGNGWSAFGAIVYVSTEPGSGMGADTDDLSFVVQGNFFFDESWEGFGRYAATIPDDTAGRAGFGALTAEDFSVITFGVNHYFIPGSQAAKFTVAADLFLDEQSLGVVPANTENNLLSSADDSQFGIRGQLQLVF